MPQTVKTSGVTWQSQSYMDSDNQLSINLQVDGEVRKYLVQDLVCLVYHGPTPSPESVSHVIDPTQPLTPDNVGWISSKVTIEIAPIACQPRRPLKRAKRSVEERNLFEVTSDGRLFLRGLLNGKWHDYMIEDLVSVNYCGPLPLRESYAFIIDLSQPPSAQNVRWMTQNPLWRTVKYG
jgi:hypothetical protein